MVTHLINQRARLLVAALTVALLPFSLSATTTASASTSSPPSRTWQVAVGQDTRNDAIQGMAFLPGTIWVNKGDKIVWTARAGEIHTVTFLAAGQPLTPFNPADPMQLLPQGGTSYDGASYYNSGVLSDAPDSGFPAQTSYQLTFAKTGTYTYWCLVHGTMMKGVVHVRAAGTSYPFTQAQYDRRSAALKTAILRDGLKLWAQTKQGATNHKVFAGADDGTAMVMRFINARVSVRVGSKVTFVNNGMAAPHTVTFGAEPANIFAPVGDPTSFRGQQLSSGIMLPGSTFTVTFKKAGTFRYICALHDFLGMVGSVTVTDD